jgi:hypothetical protein
MDKLLYICGMKYLIFLIVLVSPKVSFSQEDSLVYHTINTRSQFILDSLNVPYIPLDVRCDTTYDNHNRIAEFNKYFRNQLVFCPTQNTASYDLLDAKDIFGSLVLLLEPDGVVGESFISTETTFNSLYRIIEFFDVVEIEGKSVYFFKTSLYRMDMDGKWVVILNPTNEPILETN